MTEPQWPLWSSEHPDAVPPEVLSCPNCGQPVAPGAAYCEACGATVNPDQTVPAPQPRTPGDASTQTRRLGSRASEVVTCAACGGTIDSDGYCQICGAKAPSARDHYSESPSDWVGGVCDRGLRHSRNEDAMALWSEGPNAVLVVCDGVSSSTDPDAAATAAAAAVRDHLIEVVTSLSAADDAAAVLATAFVDASAAANQAVIAITDPDSTNAPSATLAAAVVLGDEVHFANLGDSRIYLLGEGRQELLSVDDSMAQAFIEQGMARSEAESLPRAHAITKWLGRDALDIEPRVGSTRLTAPDWVLVCSDGLWNYASEPEELFSQLTSAADQSSPVAVAETLVVWANGQGGHDNVTVALARVAALEADSNLGITDDESSPEGEG
ncbi:MAG TPA: serine/threonine protein phosphatase [Propionibacteriaceae bacterium]|nr:serine/threonine protein phosphatase [Propionibacteriaceae bacterium]